MLCAKRTITNSGATMWCSKLTFSFHHLSTGQESTRTFSNTQKPVSDANNAKNQLTNQLLFILCQCRTNQIYKYMQISLDQCLQLDASTNTSSASQTHSRNRPLSWLSKTRKQRQWPRPFFKNGFVNSASQRRFTQTAGRNLLTNYCNNFSIYAVEHTKTTPAHPQCNTQVEVFNKTVKKYLALLVNDTMLDWEHFPPALMLSYNTSYHSIIATTPFELLSERNLACLLFQTLTFSGFTMESQPQQSDINYYKNTLFS